MKKQNGGQFSRDDPSWLFCVIGCAVLFAMLVPLALVT